MLSHLVRLPLASRGNSQVRVLVQVADRIASSPVQSVYLGKVEVLTELRPGLVVDNENSHAAPRRQRLGPDLAVDVARVVGAWAAATALHAPARPHYSSTTGGTRQYSRSTTTSAARIVRAVPPPPVVGVKRKLLVRSAVTRAGANDGSHATANIDAATVCGDRQRVVVIVVKQLAGCPLNARNDSSSELRMAVRADEVDAYTF